MHSAVDAGRNLQMQVADGRQLDEAVAHLEAAYRADPANTTTHKALGLAYTWAGHLDQAEALLRGVPVRLWKS